MSETLYQTRKKEDTILKRKNRVNIVIPKEGYSPYSTADKKPLLKSILQKRRATLDIISNKLLNEKKKGTGFKSMIDRMGEAANLEKIHHFKMRIRTVDTIISILTVFVIIMYTIQVENIIICSTSHLSGPQLAMMDLSLPLSQSQQLSAIS